MDMEGAIKQLQETVIVMSGLQACQAEVLKDHGEWLEQHLRAMARHCPGSTAERLRPALLKNQMA